MYKAVQPKTEKLDKHAGCSSRNIIQSMCMRTTEHICKGLRNNSRLWVKCELTKKPSGCEPLANINSAFYPIHFSKIKCALPSSNFSPFESSGLNNIFRDIKKQCTYKEHQNRRREVGMEILQCNTTDLSANMHSPPTQKKMQLQTQMSLSHFRLMVRFTDVVSME